MIFIEKFLVLKDKMVTFSLVLGITFASEFHQRSCYFRVTIPFADDRNLNPNSPKFRF